MQLGRIANVTVLKSDPAGVVTSTIPLLNGATSEVFIELYFYPDRSSNIHKDIIARFSWKENQSLVEGLMQTAIEAREGRWRD